MNMNKKEITCYETDASGIEGVVGRVFCPTKIGEIQNVVRVASLDIVPRGAGIGLVGGAVPNNSIVVDMTKMNRVLNLNFKNNTVYVEAGVSVKELNEKLRAVGFEFPIDPCNQGISTIGGMIATNASGDRSMRYGTMRNWVESLDLVNGRGELVKIGKTDLTDVCGMEGITGIIVGATLRIILIPRKSASVFQTDNIDEVLSVARRLKLEKEVVMIKLFPPIVSKLLGFPEKYNLIIGFDSERGKIKGENFKRLFNQKNQVYYALASKGYYYSEDPKFFFDKLREFILFLEEKEIPYFGCLGDGIIVPFFEKGKDKRKDVLDFIKKIRVKFGRYGIGLKRKDFLDDSEKKIIQRVKMRYDPFSKLNKDKILDLGERESVERPTTETSLGERGAATQILEELKTPEEKLEEFIEEVSEEEKEKELKDYKNTFSSELGEDKRLKVEEITRDIVKSVNVGGDVGNDGYEHKGDKLRTISDEEKNFINNIMTNKFNKDGDEGKFKDEKKETMRK